MTIGLTAQELPPIQNFYPKDYHGENQNWAISQSPEKLIYVANSGGLLEFNGASWKLYPSPNETIMRSVKVVQDRIYTGCFMEFGYWQRNSLGTLDYTSLSQSLTLELIEDEEFWNIIDIDDYVVFQSLRRIYIYNVSSTTVTTIESDSILTKIYRVDGEIYFQRMGMGIFKIESGKDTLVFEDVVVKEDEVIEVFGTKNALLLLTKNNGFYELDDGVLVKSPSFPNELLSDLSLYTGIQLKDNSFILGSIANGILHIDREGELLSQIDQNRGLSNNTVLSVFEDIDRNIWLGLDHGITYVNLDAPYRVFNDTKGALGSVYASLIYRGNLYLGTNQGLFYKDLDGENDFSFVKGTEGQVWCLKEIEGVLLCGHHSGTYVVDDDSVTKISNIQGTWNLAELSSRPDLLLQGNYDGLYVLEKSKTAWTLRNKIKGFDNSSRYFETLGDQIFVNHEYNGVFQLKVDSTFFEVKHLVIDTLIKGANSGIVKYNGDLLYSYKEGVFKYDPNQRIFVKDSLLSSAHTKEEYESGKLIVDPDDNKLWFFNKSNISFITSNGLTDRSKVRSIPLTKAVRDGILGYENLSKLEGQGTYLLGKTSGYITFDSNAKEIQDFEVIIGSIRSGGIANDEKLLDKSFNGDFNYDENDLGFSFYAPEYNKFLTTQYQHRLKGMYNQWSTWSNTSEVLYENLPFGKYEFEVRAKIGNTISVNAASYTFVVHKPWYISNPILVIYFLGVAAFSFFMHTLYKGYYKKQRQKLIDKNQQELRFAQVQSEREIIKIKNEQLEAENKSKGKELAVSTMSIVKKNELLTTIKEELQGISDAELVKPVIKIIDKSLKENDDWELFQEAFNNADSGFLKKIKSDHPKLTPNDLKLCAYLRLNLSSKEIAQLLHISPKSVEIKRYRLRKKLDLLHEDNLVDYILAL
ncbi:MAG: hypothetical protein Mars2KO_04170 [Maribacter sp.]